MPIRVSNSQSNITLLLRGLSEDEISQVKKLNIFDQAEKIKSILKNTKEANNLRLANLKTRQEQLKREQPNNTNEINRISMYIDNLEAQGPKLELKIDELELNLAERIHIIRELLGSKYGRAAVLLPPAPKASGRKKKKTRKRKKGKKRKTRRRK